METYTIGMDFGTLSGRAILTNTKTGEIIAEAAMDYPHGVLSEALPTGEPLPRGWALQVPADHRLVLETIVPAVMKKSGIDPKQVIGIGADFTGVTLVSLDREGRPLCERPEFVHTPLAYTILWKHHGATPYTAEVEKAVKAYEPELLGRHGGRINDDCEVVKTLQILREAPEVYKEIDLILEACDWVNYLLTGEIVRSEAVASFKGFWMAKRGGYPPASFYTGIDPMLGDLPRTKFRGTIRTIGTKAGELTADMAEKLGLCPGIAVSVGQFDAHTAFVGSGITKGDTAMVTMGTSGGFLYASEKECAVEGTTSMADNGDLPGLFGYGSGQASLGDMFAWFEKNMVPATYAEAAKEAGLPVQKYLTQLAEKLAIGESGLLALDWWGGCRSILANSRLSGMILGLTMASRPEEVYRALLEAGAFGIRRILEAHEEAGLTVSDIHLVGGIVKKNPLLVQIYADVLNRHLVLCKSSQNAALGACMFAAAAAGAANGGYDTLAEATAAMAGIEEKGVDPIPENVAAYEKLYAEYRRLYDYFGRENMVMERLHS